MCLPGQSRPVLTVLSVSSPGVMFKQSNIHTRADFRGHKADGLSRPRPTTVRWEGKSPKASADALLFVVRPWWLPRRLTLWDSKSTTEKGNRDSLDRSARGPTLNNSLLFFWFYNRLDWFGAVAGLCSTRVGLSRTQRGVEGNAASLPSTRDRLFTWRLPHGRKVFVWEW